MPISLKVTVTSQKFKSNQKFKVTEFIKSHYDKKKKKKKKKKLFVSPDSC